MRRDCSVTPAQGRLIYSRVRTVGVAGERLADADGKPGINLPRGPDTVGFEIVITNRPTLAGGTDTYLLFSVSDPAPAASVVAAMADGGYGEMLAPGQSTVITVGADVTRLNLDTLGVQSDFTTEAEIIYHVSIKELVATLGRDCAEKCGG